MRTIEYHQDNLKVVATQENNKNKDYRYVIYKDEHIINSGSVSWGAEGLISAQDIKEHLNRYIDTYLR